MSLGYCLCLRGILRVFSVLYFDKVVFILSNFLVQGEKELVVVLNKSILSKRDFKRILEVLN